MLKKEKKPFGQVKFSQELMDYMLIWWIQFDGNNQKIADKVTEYRGKNTSRKTVRQIAIRENFAAKAPMLRARVTQQLQQENSTELESVTPQEIHFTDVGLDLLTIDISIIHQAKKFIQGDGRSNTPFKNMAEVIAALKYVGETIPGLTGRTDNDIRKNTLDDVTNAISTKVVGDFRDLLNDLPDDRRKYIVAKVRRKAIEGKLVIE